MYGTVARLRLKPGMGDRAVEEIRQREGEEVPQPAGFVAQYVYRMDADPDEVYLAVVFQSREAYRANAESPEQNARYQQMVELLAGPPEWHDGEIIFSLGSAT